MTPELAAGMTGFVGLCLIAGWAVGFRNRAYVGWLGVSFLALAGFILAVSKARAARELGAADEPIGTIARALLVLWLAALVGAAVSAVRETARRLQDIRASHQATAEGFVELMRAATEKEQQTKDSSAGKATGKDSDS